MAPVASFSLQLCFAGADGWKLGSNSTKFLCLLYRLDVLQGLNSALSPQIKNDKDLTPQIYESICQIASQGQP
jgi:hypothetical protein